MRFGILVLLNAALLFGESVAGVTWTAPDTWISKGPAAMRAATYTVQDAECVVYFFGQGQGGSVEANLARWSSQFTQSGMPAKAMIAKKTVHGLAVTTMDVSGAYAGIAGAGMAGAGMALAAPKPDYRMLAAIIENPGGNIFLKFTGPAKTVTANLRNFELLVASIHKE